MALRATIIKLAPIVVFLLVLTGCSARMESAAVVGKVVDYKHTDDVQRSIRISWSCRTTGIFSGLFSPSGDAGCNDERGRGEVNLPIKRNGTFEIPAFNVNVTKFFSAPTLYFKWKILSESRDGQADEVLLEGGPIHGAGFFKRVVDDYRSLRHIAIDDACVDAKVTAIDGAKQFPFDEIKLVYPDSYNFTYRYILTVTLKRDDVVVMSPSFLLDKDDGRFCARSLGLFVPDGELKAVEELVYSARIEVAAGVVYSTAPADPATGQRARDYRYVSETIGRKGKSPVKPANKLPGELLMPINLELDIGRQAPSD